jgi:hypothetical protein
MQSRLARRRDRGSGQLSEETELATRYSTVVESYLADGGERTLQAAYDDAAHAVAELVALVERQAVELDFLRMRLART